MLRSRTWFLFSLITIRIVLLGTCGYCVCIVFQKLRVWCRVSNGLWQLGKIQSTSADTSFVMLSTENVSFLKDVALSI